MASKALKLLITGDVSSAKKALAQLDDSMGKTGKKSETLGSSIKKGIGALGLGGAIWGSLSAANESLKVGHQTEAVIKSTGGAAKVTAGQVGDLATSISNATGLDDEMVQSGENMLLTFKNIRNEAGKGNDIFTQSTKIMADMSAATGQDMTSSALQLGKALNDPISGVSRLTKIGVTFTAQQKEQIKALAESGDVMGAQKIILKELTSEFGGSAAAQASGLDKVHTQLGNIAETVGTDLMPAVDAAAKGATILSSVLSQLPGPLVTVGTVVVGGAAAWTIFGSTVIGTVGTLGEMIGVLATYTPSAIVARGATAGLAEAFAAEAAAAEGAAGSTAVAGAAAKSSGGGMAGLGKTIGVAAVLAYGTGKAFGFLADRAHGMAPPIKDTAAALKLFADNGTESSLASEKAITDLVMKIDKFKHSTQGWSNSTRILSSAAHVLTLGGVSGHTAMDKLTKDINSYDRALAQLVQSGNSKEAASIARKIEAGMKAAGYSTADTKHFLNDYNKAVKDAAASGVLAKGSTDGLSSSLASQKEKTDKAKQAMDDLTSALKGWADQTTSILSANINWEGALDSVTSTLKDNGNEWDINTEKGRNNMNALIAAKNAAIDNANAMLQNGASVDQVTGQMGLFKGQLEQTLSQAGLTKDQIQFLIQEMGLTPSEIHTTIVSNLPEAQRQAQTYLDTLNAMPLEKRVRVIFDDSAGALGGAKRPGQWWGGDLPGHAWGGGLPPGWAMVGEHGPELTNGKRVIGAGRTQALLASMPSTPMAAPMASTTVVHLTVEGSVVTERDLITQVINGVNAKQRRSPRALLTGAS